MDRRVGKRTLVKIKDEVEALPEWVQQFYRLRCEADGVVFSPKRMTDEIIEAHKFCHNHKKALLNDQKCGCFFCLEIFDPKEIEYWVEDTAGTAICPYCDADSVIGESSGYPITKEFLTKMKMYWF